MAKRPNGFRVVTPSMMNCASTLSHSEAATCCGLGVAPAKRTRPPAWGELINSYRDMLSRSTIVRRWMRRVLIAGGRESDKGEGSHQYTESGGGRWDRARPSQVFFWGRRPRHGGELGHHGNCPPYSISHSRKQ